MNDEIITSYLLGKKAGGGGTPPVYQDKEITITQNGEQTITKDSGYDALNSVALTVSVPEPSGKITITQNGTDIDVSSYASADVNVPAGIDPSLYFNDTVSGTGSTSNPLWKQLIKKIPEPITVDGTDFSYLFYEYDINSPTPTITNKSSITSLIGAYYNCKNANVDDIESFNVSNCQSFGDMLNNATGSKTTLDLSNWDFKNSSTQISFTNFCNKTNFVNIIFPGKEVSVLNFSSSFRECPNLKKVDLSNMNITQSSVTYASYMFYNSTALEEIDMSSFEFTKLRNSNINTIFTGVPTNCLIYVKDQTQKDWFTTNWPSLTNVQIKGA